MGSSRRHHLCPKSEQRQLGIALLVTMFLLALWGVYLFIGQLSAVQYQATRAQKTVLALAEAKQALIGDAISSSSLGDVGYLVLPDLGSAFGTATEGQSSGTFSGDGKDRSVIGKLPWKTLSMADLRDQNGECLWYAVSGRFKNDTSSLRTDTLNWDTQGQIDIIDGKGNLIAANLAALLIATGRPLDGQNRSLADAVYTQCGGNYDARNYLDPFDSSNSIAGEVNYFASSINNRVAGNADNKRFAMTDSDHHNDRFLFVTVDDIFSPIIRRSDFATAISNLLDNPAFWTHLQSITLTGSKGTGALDCGHAPDKSFCENWKEMLLLTELSMPTTIKIDGAASNKCSRVLLFAGRKGAGQHRESAGDKANPLNYLENSNATSFAAPKAKSDSFSGTLSFDWHNPSTDLVRCLP